MDYSKNLTQSKPICNKNVLFNFYHFYFTSVLVTERVETQHVMNYRAIKMKWSLTNVY